MGGGLCILPSFAWDPTNLLGLKRWNGRLMPLTGRCEDSEVDLSPSKRSTPVARGAKRSPARVSAEAAVFDESAIGRAVRNLRSGVENGRYAPGQRLIESDLTR